jgi:4-amino-4-deoxy-L-arabinose transferase
MIWSGNWWQPLRRLWLVVLATLVTVLPWAIAVHVSAPDFWRYFVVVEHLNRFAGAQAQHEAPFYFYALALPLLLFPWILQLGDFFRPGFVNTSLMTITTPDQQVSRQSALKLLVCWALLPLLFFSISKGKLPTYILPCLMPLVILFALRVEERRSRAVVNAFAVSSWLLLCLLTVLLLAFCALQFTDIGTKVYGADEQRSLLLMIAMLCGACVLAFSAVRTREAGSRSVLMGLAALPIILAFSLALPDSVIDRKAPGRFLRQFDNTESAESILVADGSMVHSVAWVFKRQDVYMLSSGELAYGLSQPEAADRLLDADGLARLKSSLQPGQSMLVFFRGAEPQSLSQFVNEADATYQQGKFFAVVFKAGD